MKYNCDIYFFLNKICTDIFATVLKMNSDQGSLFSSLDLLCCQ